MANPSNPPVNIDAVLATIRQMESGGNYTVVTSGGSDACGAYQYITSTWQGMLHRTIQAGWLPQNTPMYSRACQAPPQVQDTVARYDVTSFLGSVGNNVSLVPLHWYYPAAIQSWPAMANYTPPGNSISLGAYQAKWMNAYALFAGGGSPSNGGGSQGSGPNPVNPNTAIKYNYAQLEQLWINASGNPQVAKIAAAVALAESGGNPNAISPSNDYGLWQINIIHGAQATLDVMANARAAVAISNNGSNWGPWCTCWVDPKNNCGHFLGPTPQPGSPAAKLIQNNVAPDPNTPLNGTGAATATPTPPNTATETGFFSGCNTLEWALAPGPCAAGSAVSGGASALAGAPAHLAGQIIDLLIGSFINPFIAIAAGIMGMTSGAVIMLLGLFMLVKDSTPVQAMKSMAETAGVAAVAPEALPAVGAAQQAQQSSQQTKTQPKKPNPNNTKRQQQAQRRKAIRSQAERYKPQLPAGAE